jgi:hypothetical protein
MDWEWAKSARESDEFQIGLDFFFRLCIHQRKTTRERDCVLVLIVTIEKGLQGM